MDVSVPGTDASDFSHYVKTACKVQPVRMMKAVLLEEHWIFALKLHMIVSEADHIPTDCEIVVHRAMVGQAA
jgi:hypothetical protein